ncbi:MAG: GGDEF domain-containing protein [Chloroflexi bacterium]|nr:MAG: GGDEF domain-containing protein [Chloroflexota bacterium]
MGEVRAQVPPFASPAEVAIGTFWAFLRVLRVRSVFGVIRKVLSAHPRGALPRYIAAVVGAAFVYGIEQLLTDNFARCAVADFAWTAAAIGAIFGTARAVRASREKDRMVWLLFCAGSVSWLIGQLLRDAAEVGGLPIPSPLVAELGFMTAAPIWTIAFVLLLRRHGQRLTLYALVLDVGAVVLTLAAAVTLFLATTLATDVSRDPQASAVAVLYPLLYVAATAAALSAVWGLPQQEPRGAVTSLFIGLGLNALAFVLYLPANVEGTFKAGTPIDALWIVGVGAVGIAGAQWVEDREDGRNSRLSGAVTHISRMVLPGVVAAACSFLLVYTDIRRVPERFADLIDAAVAFTVLVLATRAGLALYTNWQLGERERRRAEELAVLYDVGLATAGELSLDELAGLVAREATALTGTDGAMVALADTDKNFIVRAVHNAPALGLRSSVGEDLRGVALECLRTREVVVAPDYRDHPDSNPALHDLIASAIAAPLVAHGEIVGTLTAYVSRPRAFSEETLRLVRLYAAQAAIAIANAALLAETRRLARDDDLTGVLNRRSLLERLEVQIADATRHGETFGVVLCDVDGLKAVNDSAGHLVGNEVLRTLARAMRQATRVEDVVARFGGDEFVLLLPRTGPLPAQAIVGRIAARLREERYMWAGQANELPRASFGIAWFPIDGRDADALISTADARMYEDKARARTRRVTAVAEAD